MVSNNEPQGWDITKQHLKLKLNQDMVLFETEKPGFVGGFINFSKLGGPGEATLDTDVHLEIPGGGGDMEWVKYRTLTLSGHSLKGQPCLFITEFFAPFGARLTLKQTNGIDTSYYYYIYRKPCEGV